MFVNKIVYILMTEVFAELNVNINFFASVIISLQMLTDLLFTVDL